LWGGVGACHWVGGYLKIIWWARWFCNVEFICWLTLPGHEMGRAT
jgi:hypothetical protein